MKHQPENSPDISVVYSNENGMIRVQNGCLNEKKH